MLKKYADYTIPRPEIFLDEDDDVALEKNKIANIRDRSGVSTNSFNFFYFICLFYRKPFAVIFKK